MKICINYQQFDRFLWKYACICFPKIIKKKTIIIDFQLCEMTLNQLFCWPILRNKFAKIDELLCNCVVERFGIFNLRAWWIFRCPKICNINYLAQCIDVILIYRINVLKLNKLTAEAPILRCNNAFYNGDIISVSQLST